MPLHNRSMSSGRKMIRSAPICLAERTPSSPTVLSPEPPARALSVLDGKGHRLVH